MKKTFFLIIIMSMAGIIFFLSCKKEYSCEKCIGNNKPPVAVAGTDTVITLPTDSVLLNGSKSSDPDGKISEWQWTKLSGPASSKIVSAIAAITLVSNLKVGVYQFELKVTDADGMIDRDTMIVTVMAVNQPPTYTRGRIVFVSDRDGNPEIYSCNPDGSNISRLTNDAAGYDEPAWSPDGKHIAFVSDRTGHPEIYIMNADGSKVVRRTFLESYAANPAWSADGARIAYSSSGNDSANISLVSAMSGPPTVLFEDLGRISSPSWSPDGTKLAVVSDRNAYDFVWDIYTINSNGTNLMALTDDIFDRLDYLSPRWSPSGTKLAVMIRENISTGDAELVPPQYRTQIGVMNPGGSGITTIISGGILGTKISWSPDGTNIVYTSLIGTRKDILWVSADGKASGTVVTNGWNADWQH